MDNQKNFKSAITTCTCTTTNLNRTYGENNGWMEVIGRETKHGLEVFYV